MNPKNRPLTLDILTANGFFSVRNSESSPELKPEALGENSDFFENLLNDLPEGLTVFAYEIPEGIKPHPECAPPWIKRILDNKRNHE